MIKTKMRKKTTMLEKAPFLLSFFIPVLIMLGIFIQRQIFPFGDNSFLRTDMYHQYAPFLNEFMEKLKTGGSLFYSWNIGMGSNFIALYAYYLASPVNWLAFLVPQSLMIEFLSYMIVLKIGLCGLTFCWYLSRHFKTRDVGMSFFAIFYALSAYMAAYSWNVMWLDCLVLAPVIFLGLERLVKEDKGLLYCLALALSIISNYYISIMMCIFMVLYFIALMVMEPACLKARLKKCVNFGIYSLLAGGLAAFLLIPVMMALRLTASGDINIPKTLTSYFSCFEMLARHFVNVETEIGLDHWPNIYCGVAVLLLFPLYMMNKKISKREKAVKGILLFVMLLGFSLNIPNFIWHGFHFPNSLPARQSFLYIALLLTMCYEAYKNIRWNTNAQLAGSFWGAAIFIFLCEAIITEETFAYHIYYVTLLLVGLYALLLYYHRNRKAWAPTLAVFTAALVSIEASMNTAVTSVTTTDRVAYLENQDSYRALAEKIETEDPSLFRIEKASRKTKNDAALAGYHSASLFSSTANSHLSDLYKEFGMEGNTNAYSFTGATPLSSALMGVKYTLSTKELDPELYTLMNEDGNVKLYKNQYALPIGFMIPSDIEDRWDYNLHNPIRTLNSFATGATNCGDIFVPVNEGSSSPGKFTLTVRETGFLYIDVLNSSIKDVTVNTGAETKEFSNVDRGYLLDIGKCEAGSVITLTTEQEDNDLKASAYRLDMEQLNRCISTLNRQPFITDHYTDTYVSGRITASSDGLLYTSIPYESGWTVKVDGTRVTPTRFADTMLAVPMTSGSHSVEFSYRPAGQKTGFLICGISLLLLILFTLLKRITEKPAGSMEGELPGEEPDPSEPTAAEKISLVKRHERKRTEPPEAAAKEAENKTDDDADKAANDKRE